MTHFKKVSIRRKIQIKWIVSTFLWGTSFFSHTFYFQHDNYWKNTCKSFFYSPNIFMKDNFWKITNEKRNFGGFFFWDTSNYEVNKVTMAILWVSRKASLWMKGISIKIKTKESRVRVKYEWRWFEQRIPNSERSKERHLLDVTCFQAIQPLDVKSNTLTNWLMVETRLRQ